MSVARCGREGGGKAENEKEDAASDGLINAFRVFFFFPLRVRVAKQVASFTAFRLVPRELGQQT